MKDVSPPPLYTLLYEVTGWTLDRTAGIPKPARFTFGQRMDNLALDALEGVIRALQARDTRVKKNALMEADVDLAKLKALWRLVCDRGWISERQLLHINSKLAEAGRMLGGWLKQLGMQPGPA